jgi:hydrogenase expression/formation protein HypC
MCLAIPGKIIELNGDIASVEYGEGVVNKANVSLVVAKVRDYVLVHAGFAIQVLSEEDAKETLAVWEELLEQEEAP